MTMSHTRSSSVRSGAPAVDLARYRNLGRRGTTIARSFRLNDADVEDVVQDALVRMLKVPADGEGSPRRYESYFDSTVRHLCIDLLRKRGRETEMPEPDDLPTQTRSERHEQRMLVRQVLAEMPASARSILVKSHIEGRTLSEISGELGISSNACSAMLYRARRTFRDRYVRSHVLPTADEQCAAVRALMVDTALSPDSEHEVTVRNHRNQCEDCEAQFAFLLTARSAAASALLPGALAAATAGGAFAFLGLGRGGAAGKTGPKSGGSTSMGTVGIAAAAVVVVAGVGAFALTNRTPEPGLGSTAASQLDGSSTATDAPVPPAPLPTPSTLPTVEPISLPTPALTIPITTPPTIPAQPSPRVRTTPRTTPAVVAEPAPQPTTPPVVAEPTPVPTTPPTQVPTQQPTAPQPTVEPTSPATEKPTDPPTEEPTEEPTAPPVFADGEIVTSGNEGTVAAGDPFDVTVKAGTETLENVVVTVTRSATMPPAGRKALASVTTDGAAPGNETTSFNLGTIAKGTSGTPATVPGSVTTPGGVLAVTVEADNRATYTTTYSIATPQITLDGSAFSGAITGSITNVADGTPMTVWVRHPGGAPCGYYHRAGAAIDPIEVGTNGTFAIPVPEDADEDHGVYLEITVTGPNGGTFTAVSLGEFVLNPASTVDPTETPTPVETATP